MSSDGLARNAFAQDVKRHGGFRTESAVGRSALLFRAPGIPQVGWQLWKVVATGSEVNGLVDGWVKRVGGGGLVKRETTLTQTTTTVLEAAKK